MTRAALVVALAGAVVVPGLVARSAAAGPATGAASAEPGPADAERDVVEVSPPPGVDVTEVTIDNRYGDVTVVGHDRGEVAVEAIKRSVDPDVIDRLKVQLVPDPRGRIAVTALLKADGEERPVAAGTIGIDLVVRVPRAAHVVARLWRGRAAVRGVDRGADLAVERGDIAVQAVSGRVSAESSSGAQRFEEILGSLEARAIEGDLWLDAVRGTRLQATVFRGRLQARRIRVRDVAIDVAHGDVDLRLEPVLGGRYVVAAWRGDVVLSVAGQVPVRLVARAGAKLEVPRRLRAQRRGKGGELIGHLGGGTNPAVIDLSSRIGDVNVTLAEF